MKQHAFTLIELLITLAIIGIITAFAYPSYINYVTKARRSDAQIALLDLAARMERYYSENNHSYEGATLETLSANETTTQGFYTLSISNLSADTYLLAAKPLGAQAEHDMACATLTLDQFGRKSNTGNSILSECW